MPINVPLKKLHPEAVVPSYAHEGDAGVDLFSVDNHLLKSGERKLIPTGLSIAIPIGYEAHVRPKSGLALKNGISVLNTPGTIDSGYRGEIGVILINHSLEDYSIEKGKKIAQMTFNKVEQASFEEVESLEEDTSRGEGGFGSTGI